MPDDETTTSLKAEEPSSSVYDALLAPKRLAELEQCDKHIQSYQPTSFWLIFRLRGRRFDMIAGPLLCLLIWDIGWAVFLLYFDTWSVRDVLQRMNPYLNQLLTPVTFLLVFRLGRAAVRYWDARAAAGKMVEVCRTFSSTALVACGGKRNNHQQYYAEEMARWIAVFPIAVKNFLRQPRQGNDEHRIQQIGQVLRDTDRDELLSLQGNQRYGPVLVLNRLRQLVFEMTVGSEETDGTDAASAMLYRQLNEQLDTLTGAWGAMERIQGTPLPFVYVVHLRTFLLVYLFLMNVQAIAVQGWIAMPPILLINWGLLGIEAAAVECESPFKLKSNHLALGKACIVVSKNVAHTMVHVGLVGPQREESSFDVLRLDI